MVSETLKWLAAVGLVTGATALKVEACVEKQQAAQGKPAHQQRFAAVASSFPESVLERLVVPSPVP